jgi:hypothetical protein
LLSLVAGSAADFEASGETALLDQDLIAPRCARLSETMIALRNSFQSANAPALSSKPPDTASVAVMSSQIPVNHQTSATGNRPVARTAWRPSKPAPTGLQPTWHIGTDERRHAG